MSSSSKLDHLHPIRNPNTYPWANDHNSMQARYIYGRLDRVSFQVKDQGFRNAWQASEMLNVIGVYQSQ